MSALPRLTSTDAVTELVEESRQRDIWIFKHSLICPVSTAGFREFEGFIEDRDSPDGSYVIEIQRARDVSNAVAAELGVRHESPQAILLRDGEVAWHASHWDITRKALAAA